MQNLSKRLTTIAELVKKGSAVCDIGTDHAYLAIYLLKEKIAKRVIATDVNEKPLKNAQKNIDNAAVSGVELRLCDGLSGIDVNEVNTIIIAGMGGEVISGILERGFSVAAQKDVTLILQPTTSPDFLRRFLYENGYEIIEETPIFENGKLYSVMVVNFTNMKASQDEGFYYFGKVLPTTEEGLMYIKKQQNRCEACFKSLENIPTKKAEYLHYKSAFQSIESYLKSFSEENYNGV